MKVLILSTAFSGLTQRVVRELICLGHEVDSHYGMDAPQLRRQIAAFRPDIIICPFLTRRIPDDIWQNYTCLIVHPGIEGDRGPSSLDWCISEGTPQWGVTLLQADAEMDAGDIWGTATFPMRTCSKISVYKREVTTAAVKLIKQALHDCADPTFAPRPLDYDQAHVIGRCRDAMRQVDRYIDWQRDSTEAVLNKINAADSSPGVKDSLGEHEVFLYGAREAQGLHGTSGEIIAVQCGAICRATRDGAVWIRQLKCVSHEHLAPIKLPAAYVCRELLPASEWAALALPGEHSGHEDIRVRRRGDVAYVYFDFYNGAANTQQCIDLKNQLIALKRSDAKVIVLMGGEDFWCNGIHLNCIEGSPDPALESWKNINAINDVVLEIIDSPNQMMVAALRNNAGAGGAIMALACDKVIARSGTVHNPHYRSMGLYGSEYWTYLLPRRVGADQAARITHDCEPMLAVEALQLGFADMMFPEDWEAFHDRLYDYCLALSQRSDLGDLLYDKRQLRARDERQKPLSSYRKNELSHMRKAFYNPTSDYHRARRQFVLKEKPASSASAPIQRVGVA